MWVVSLAAGETTWEPEQSGLRVILYQTTCPSTLFRTVYEIIIHGTIRIIKVTKWIIEGFLKLTSQVDFATSSSDPKNILQLELRLGQLFATVGNLAIFIHGRSRFKTI